MTQTFGQSTSDLHNTLLNSCMMHDTKLHCKDAVLMTLQITNALLTKLKCSADSETTELGTWY